MWFAIALLAFLFVGLAFATKTLTGSVDSAKVNNPLYISAIDRFEIPDVVISVVLLNILIGSVGSQRPSATTR